MSKNIKPISKYNLRYLSLITPKINISAVPKVKSWFALKKKRKKKSKMIPYLLLASKTGKCQCPQNAEAIVKKQSLPWRVSNFTAQQNHPDHTPQTTWSRISGDGAQTSVYSEIPRWSWCAAKVKVCSMERHNRSPWPNLLTFPNPLCKQLFNHIQNLDTWRVPKEKRLWWD